MEMNGIVTMNKLNCDGSLIKLSDSWLIEKGLLIYNKPFSIYYVL